MILFGLVSFRIPPDTFPMNPEAALANQIEQYRKMTGEQRLALALELHELSCDVARAGIQAQHPKADIHEVERLLATTHRTGDPAMTERELLAGRILPKQT